MGLWIINKGIKPTLMRYAESQTSKIATLVINRAMDKKITSMNNSSKMYEIVPNEKNNSISMIKFNTEEIQNVLYEATKHIQQNLKEAEHGNLAVLEEFGEVEIDADKSKEENGIVYYVPLGQATNNVFLGNLGPKVPVRFNAIGEVLSDIKTKVEEKGINNTWVEVLIHIEVKVQIIIPFATKVTTVQTDIPVAMTLVPGEVPPFYPPSVSWPVEKKGK